MWISRRIECLFAPGTDNRFSRQGTSTGMLKKVEGGHLLSGRWSYGRGMYHATFSHSAALVDDGTGKPANDEKGDGRAEARVRAARAFLFDVWHDVEASIEAGNRVSTRQISLIHLAKSEVHEAGIEACMFAMRSSGGAGIRSGVIQRVFRDMMTAASHFTINPNIVGAAGRDLGGIWSERVWQFYDLVEREK